MGLWVIHHSNGNATLCKVTFCPVALQLCLCGHSHQFTCVIMLHYLPLYSKLHSFLKLKTLLVRKLDTNTAVVSLVCRNLFWKCVAFLKSDFSQHMSCQIVAWECASKSCAQSFPSYKAVHGVYILHQFYWPTKRGVEEMSLLCSTLIGHSSRLYPHFNWYNAV